jgi:hypothetical protein
VSQPLIAKLRVMNDLGHPEPLGLCIAAKQATLEAVLLVFSCRRHSDHIYDVVDDTLG